MDEAESEAAEEQPVQPLFDAEGIQKLVLALSRAAAMPGWISDYNLHRPHSALGGRPPISRLTASPQTPPPAVPGSDPESGCGRRAGVKARAATATGGLALTPVRRTQAQSAIGNWDNVLGNDS